VDAMKEMYLPSWYKAVDRRECPFANEGCSDAAVQDAMMQKVKMQRMHIYTYIYIHTHDTHAHAHAHAHTHTHTRFCGGVPERECGRRMATTR
jgi:hypothetical protein